MKGNPEGARVRYRYYVSRDLHLGRTTQGFRLPAGEIERVTAERIVALLSDGTALLEVLGPAAALASALKSQCNRLAAALSTRAREDRQRLLAMLIVRLTVSADSIAISLCRAALINELAGSPNNRHRSGTSTDPIVLHLNVQLERRAQNKRLIIHGDAKPPAQPDRRISSLLIKAQGWKDELMRDSELTVSSLGARHGVTRSYVARILRLAFLAPDITHALLEGTAPLAITADTLARRIKRYWQITFERNDRRTRAGER